MGITTTLLTLAVTAAATSQSSAPQTVGASPTPVVLEIGLHIMRGDRQTNMATTSNGDQVAGYVWTDLGLCSAGAGDREPGIDRVRWRIAGHIVTRTSGSVLVDAEWQRIGANGAPDGATSTRQITIAPGGHVVLDEIAPQGASPCQVTVARLEAAIVTPDANRGRGVGAGTSPGGGFGGGGAGASGGGRGAGGSGGASGGSGGGRGRGIGSGSGFGPGGAGAGPGTGASGSGGTGAGPVVGAGGGGAGAGMSGGGGGGRGRGGASGTGGGAVASGGAGGFGGAGAAGGSPMSAVDLARLMGNSQRAVISPSPSSGAVAGMVGPLVNLVPMPGAAFDAEVWLVHTPPGGAEETQKMTVHVTSEGQVLSFPITPVTTDRGPVNIDVAVMLSPRLTEDGTRVLQVVVARGLRGSANSLGSSIKVITLPSPADIVSFEMPQVSPRGVPAPIPDHQFSVRIRLSPSKHAAGAPVISVA